MTTLADPTKPLSPLAQFRRRTERLRIARMAHRVTESEQTYA